MQQYNRSPTSIKIIQCMREKNSNQTFTGLDAESGLGIIIVIAAIGWIVRDWYIDRKNRSVRTEHRKK